MNNHITRDQLLENLGIPECPYDVEITFQGAIRFSDILPNDDYIVRDYMFYEPEEALAAFEEYRTEYFAECGKDDFIED